MRLAAVLPCKACFQPTPHTETESVRTRRVFMACDRCGTIQNVPETEEMRRARRGEAPKG